MTTGFASSDGFEFFADVQAFGFELPEGVEEAIGLYVDIWLKCDEGLMQMYQAQLYKGDPDQGGLIGNNASGFGEFMPETITRLRFDSWGTIDLSKASVEASDFGVRFSFANQDEMEDTLHIDAIRMTLVLEGGAESIDPEEFLRFVNVRGLDRRGRGCPPHEKFPRFFW